MSDRPTLAELAAQAARNDAGVWECPNCGCKDTRVRKTWDAAAGRRRSRVCRNCGKSSLLTTEVEVPKGFKVVVVPDESIEEERACA